jgi:hypothetical protein
MKLLGSTAVALALGLGACLSGPAAAQQLQFACDANDDGFVDAQESKRARIANLTRSRQASRCLPRRF